MADFDKVKDYYADQISECAQCIRDKASDEQLSIAIGRWEIELRELKKCRQKRKIDSDQFNAGPT